MTNEELREIEERHERNIQDIKKYGPVERHERQLLTDRGALLAEIKRLEEIVGASLDFARHRLGCKKYEYGDCDCGYKEWSDRACAKSKDTQ